MSSFETELSRSDIAILKAAEVYDRGGSCRQIADRAEHPHRGGSYYDYGTTYRMLRSLARRGFIEIGGIPRKRVTYTVTEKGREAIR